MIKKLDKVVEVNPHKNDVSLVGTIISTPTLSHQYDNQNHYSVKMRVDRRYDRFDEIHLFIPDNMIIQNGCLIDKGISIRVKGRIVQSEFINLRDISVIAETLETVPNETSHENEVTIVGKVYKCYPIRGSEEPEKGKNAEGKTLKVFLIKNISPDESRIASIKISSWNHTARYVDANIHESDLVMIKGKIVSYTKPVAVGKNNKRDAVYHEIAASLVVPARDETAEIVESTEEPAEEITAAAE